MQNLKRQLGVQKKKYSKPPLMLWKGSTPGVTLFPGRVAQVLIPNYILKSYLAGATTAPSLTPLS